MADPKTKPEGCEKNVLCQLLKTRKTEKDKEDDDITSSSSFDPSQADDPDEKLLKFPEKDREAINHLRRNHSIKDASLEMFRVKYSLLDKLDAKQKSKESLLTLWPLMAGVSSLPIKVHDALKEAFVCETTASPSLVVLGRTSRDRAINSITFALHLASKSIFAVAVTPTLDKRMADRAKKTFDKAKECLEKLFGDHLFKEWSFKPILYFQPDDAELKNTPFKKLDCKVELFCKKCYHFLIPNTPNHLKSLIKNHIKRNEHQLDEKTVVDFKVMSRYLLFLMQSANLKCVQFKPGKLELKQPSKDSDESNQINEDFLSERRLYEVKHFTESFIADHNLKMQIDESSEFSIDEASQLLFEASELQRYIDGEGKEKIECYIHESFNAAVTDATKFFVVKAQNFISKHNNADDIDLAVDLSSHTIFAVLHTHNFTSEDIQSLHETKELLSKLKPDLSKEWLFKIIICGHAKHPSLGESKIEEMVERQSSIEDHIKELFSPYFCRECMDESFAHNKEDLEKCIRRHIETTMKTSDLTDSSKLELEGDFNAMFRLLVFLMQATSAGCPETQWCRKFEISPLKPTPTKVKLDDRTETDHALKAKEMESIKDYLYRRFPSRFVSTTESSSSTIVSEYSKLVFQNDYAELEKLMSNQEIAMIAKHQSISNGSPSLMEALLEAKCSLVIPSPKQFFDRDSKLASVTFALDLRSQTIFAIVKTKTNKFTESKFHQLNLVDVEKFFEEKFGADVSSDWKLKTIVFVEEDEMRVASNTGPNESVSNDALCKSCFSDLVVDSKKKLVQMIKKHTANTCPVTKEILNEFKLMARYLLFFSLPFKPICAASTHCKKLDLLKIEAGREGVKLDDRAATDLVQLMSWPEMKSLEEAVDKVKPFDYDRQSVVCDSHLLFGKMDKLQNSSSIIGAVTPSDPRKSQLCKDQEDRLAKEDLALLKQSQAEFQEVLAKKDRSLVLHDFCLLDPDSRILKITSLALNQESNSIFALVALLPKDYTMKSAEHVFEYLIKVKKCLEEWFGADICERWNFKPIVYCKKEKRVEKIFCSDCYNGNVANNINRLEEIIGSLKKNQVTDKIIQDFKLMSRYLIFFQACTNQVSFVKQSGQAKSFTPHHMSLMETKSKVVLYSSLGVGMACFGLAACQKWSKQQKKVLLLVNNQSNGLTLPLVHKLKKMTSDDPNILVKSANIQKTKTRDLQSLIKDECQCIFLFGTGGIKKSKIDILIDGKEKVWVASFGDPEFVTSFENFTLMNPFDELSPVVQARQPFLPSSQYVLKKVFVDESPAVLITRNQEDAYVMKDFLHLLYRHSALALTDWTKFSDEELEEWTTSKGSNILIAPKELMYAADSNIFINLDMGDHRRVENFSDRLMSRTSNRVISVQDFIEFCGRLPMNVDGYVQMGSSLINAHNLISSIFKRTSNQAMSKGVTRELHDSRNLLDILLQCVKLLKCCISLSTIGLTDDSSKKLVLCPGTCGYGANKSCPSAIEFRYSFSYEHGSNSFIFLLVSGTNGQVQIKSPSDLHEWVSKNYGDQFATTQSGNTMTVLVKSGLKRLKDDVSRGDLNAVKATLKEFENQLDLTDYCDNKQTFLHLAANSGHDSIIKHFLDECSDLRTRERFWAKDDQGNTVLHNLANKLADAKNYGRSTSVFYEDVHTTDGIEMKDMNGSNQTSTAIGDIEAQRPMGNDGNSQSRQTFESNGNFEQCLKVILENKELKLPKFLATSGASDPNTTICETLKKLPLAQDYVKKLDEDKWMTRSNICEDLIACLTDKNDKNEKKLKELLNGLKKDDCAKDLLKATINNSRKSNDNTALFHAASKGWSKDVIDDLFVLGASIGGLGDVSIKNVPPEQLRRVLDYSWQTCDDDKSVIINYNFLQRTHDDGEAETSILLHMTESDEHQTLVTHPVIKAFLWRKWKENWWLYYINLIVFSIFVFAISGLNYNRAEMSNECPGWKIFVIFMTCILGFREVCQMVSSREIYFKKNLYENLLEIALIILTALHVAPFDSKIQRYIGAIVLVYACILFILLLGKHPQLKFFGIYLQVLMNLKMSFIKFIATFGWIVLAFGFGFCVILREADVNSSSLNSTLFTNDTLESDSLNNATEKHAFQQGFWQSSFKILAMFVGELDYDALQDTQDNLSFLHFFFAAFVCIVVIVLMNFITGLAVEDVATMKASAEIWYYINIIQTIAYLDSLWRSSKQQKNKIKLKLRPFRNARCCPNGNFSDLGYECYCQPETMNADVLEIKWIPVDVIESFKDEIRRKNNNEKSIEDHMDKMESSVKMDLLRMQNELDTVRVDMENSKREVTKALDDCLKKLNSLTLQMENTLQLERFEKTIGDVMNESRNQNQQLAKNMAALNSLFQDWRTANAQSVKENP